MASTNLADIGVPMKDKLKENQQLSRKQQLFNIMQDVFEAQNLEVNDYQGIEFPECLDSEEKQLSKIFHHKYS